MSEVVGASAVLVLFLLLTSATFLFQIDSWTTHSLAAKAATGAGRSWASSITWIRQAGPVVPRRDQAVPGTGDSCSRPRRAWSAARACCAAGVSEIKVFQSN